MIRTILRTNDSFAPLVMRLGLIPFFLMGVLGYMLAIGTSPGPHPWSWIPIGIALGLGGLFLVLGWCTRIVAAVTAAYMLVMFARTPPLTLSSQSGECFEVLALVQGAALAIALAITGGGRLSLDQSVDRREPRNGSGSASHVLRGGAQSPASGSAVP